MSSVRVKVEGEEIVVTDPATDWRVSYRRSAALNGLIATQVATDRKATVSERSLFLAKAFQKAIDKARKLGWMVYLPRSLAARAVKSGRCLGTPETLGLERSAALIFAGRVSFTAQGRALRAYLAQWPMRWAARPGL